jgi:P-type E1-E2 ATPase
LVVCADDIAIAVPLAFIASIGHAAKKGVIIKGGDFLEGINKVKILVVDKTGTLTRGKLKVENIFIFDDRESNDVLRFAGAASLFSSHPSAKAILKYVEENGIKPEQPDNFEEKSGKGAEAAYKGKKIATGKQSFLEELGIKISEHQKRDIQNEKNKGLNTTLIGYDGSLIGFFTLADEIRPNVKNILSELKDLGIEKIIMLTGDNEKIAQRIAEKVGITEYHANLLPEDKLKYLEKYLDDKYKVMAIGDGVNDAALLNAADIGIAMGGIGADVTIESGDIVLMQDNLSQVPETMRLAKYTARVSKQNFVIWGITNGIGLSLVFSGFIPAIILPTFAAAFNFVTDFAPILNSARLFNVHIKE